MTSFAINRKLLPLKANYFLINAGHAGVIPFIAVYAKQLGIGADVMGYIFAIISCITVLSKPLIGGLSDHFQRLKFLVISLALIDIVADMGLNFIPAPIQKSTSYTNSSLICLRNSSYVLSFDMEDCRTMNNTFDCFAVCISSCSICQPNRDNCKRLSKVNSTYDNSSVFFHIPLNCTDAILEKCDSDIKTTCNEECIGDSVTCNSDSKANPTLQIWLLGIFTAMIYVCNGSIGSLSDAACFNALGNKPELFGRQRLWGTIGWGTFALLAGYLNQVLTGSSKTYSYSAGFYLMVALLLLDLTVLTKLEVKKVKTSRNIFKDVGLLFAKPRIILFILQVFSIGVFIGLSRTYLFWYLRSLDANQLVLGLNSIMQCFLGELPFFFFSGWIITKIGHVNTFTMSFAANGVKFLSYSFLFNPWWGLPIEIMQGPCFGSFYAAMTSYAKIVAPTGTEATVQGLASATFEGLGLATGSLLGGYGFRVFGGRTTFFWTGIISFIFALLNSIANAVLILKEI